MLDIKFIRENPEKVQEACENKQVKCDVNRLLELDKKRRELIAQSEGLRAEQKKAGQDNIDRARELKERFKELASQLTETEQEYNNLLGQIPNMPLDDVPVGKNENNNKVLRQEGKPPRFDFQPKEHWQLGKELDIIDAERAAKAAGSRFYYLKREAALLEFALINFVFEKLLKKGFVPVIPPAMINKKMAWAMGYLQQTDDEEAYFLPKDELYLIATSEQTLGAMHAAEVFEGKDLPLRYVGFSTCFRREAGSYGRDTKGILRVHQFDKIEMFVFCKPEQSQKEHEDLLVIEEELMKDLKLPYQVINICTGDLGVPAAKKYDIEAWLAGQGRYRETHSTSNCTDFQARRLNIRYRGKNGKLEFVHTLNGTALAIGRTSIAILENNQKKDGSIEMPKALHKYLPFKKIEIKRTNK